MFLRAGLGSSIPRPHCDLNSAYAVLELPGLAILSSSRS
jgi:hypothetical protein